MKASSLALLLAGSLVMPVQAVGDHPDILLIAIDDLNDWVGALGGHPQARTPNIDRLASRGIIFTNAHVTAPLCNPSRASLMSGMLPSSFGVYVNRQDWREAPALEGKPVLPLFLQRSGYRTLGGGKLFHAATVNPVQFYGLLPREGFDDYYPAPNRQLPDEIRPLGRPVNKNPGFIGGFFDWSPVSAEDTAMGDGQVVSWASQQLQAKFERPLFVGVGIYRPHIPWYVPQTYFDMHPLDRVELPATVPGDLDDVPGSERYASNQRVHRWVLESGNWKRGVQAYLASISFADAMVGRLLDALDSSDRAESTIVVLFSDHGYHLGEKGPVAQVHAMGGFDSRPADRRCTGTHGTGNPVCSGRVHLGHLPYAGGSCGPASPRSPGREQLAPPAGGPGCGLASPRDHYVPIWKSFSADSSLPLYPLCKRRRGTLRSPQRPARVAQPRFISGARRPQGKVGVIASDGQRRPNHIELALGVPV